MAEEKEPGSGKGQRLFHWPHLWPHADGTLGLLEILIPSPGLWSLSLSHKPTSAGKPSITLSLAYSSLGI